MDKFQVEISFSYVNIWKGGESSKRERWRGMLESIGSMIVCI